MAIAGSVVTLGMGAAMLAAGVFGQPPENTPPSPVPFKVLMGGMAVILAAMGGWGLGTGICVLRRHRWARISMLVFSGLLTFVASGASLSMLFLKPPPAPEGAEAMMPVIFRAIAGFYAILAAIGIWWLVLFNCRGAKEYFATPGGREEGGKPISISIIGWFLVIGAASILFPLLLRLPAILFGSVLTGWAATAVYACWAAAQAYAGVAVLRLKETGRIVAIGFFIFGALNMVASVARLGSAELMRQSQAAMPQFFPANPPPSGYPPMGVMAGMSVVMFAIPVFFLVRRRAAFSRV